MSCRCDDIWDAEQDRDILDNVYKDTMNLYLLFGELKDTYDELLRFLDEAMYFKPHEFATISSNIRNKLTLREGKILKYNNHIDNEIDKLVSRIYSMEREDTRYHDDCDNN